MGTKEDIQQAIEEDIEKTVPMAIIEEAMDELGISEDDLPNPIKSAKLVILVQEKLDWTPEKVTQVFVDALSDIDHGPGLAGLAGMYVKNFSNQLQEKGVDITKPKGQLQLLKTIDSKVLRSQNLIVDKNKRGWAVREIKKVFGLFEEVI